MAKYVAKHDLLNEIAKTKNSYCSFLEPEHANYDFIVEDEAEITADRLAELGKNQAIIRLMTYRHIPLLPVPDEPPKKQTEGKQRGRPPKAGAGKGKQRGRLWVRTNFPPFVHLLAELRDGQIELTEVGRSHWVGGLSNGHFSTTHGKWTNRLAMLVDKQVKRQSTQANFNRYSYLDEMMCAARVQMCQAALEFNEAKSDNPFAYFTTTINRAMIRVIKTEKRQQNIRDELLEEYGMAPSWTRQDAAYLKQFEPPALTAENYTLVQRRGRPKKAA